MPSRNLKTVNLSQQNFPRIGNRERQMIAKSLTLAFLKQGKGNDIQMNNASLPA